MLWLFLERNNTFISWWKEAITLDDLFVAASPLFVPATRVTVSGVPSFIPNEVLERELSRFGRFSSGIRMVHLDYKEDCFQHVQSLRRRDLMYLSDQSVVLELTFKVNIANGFSTLYASLGSRSVSTVAMWDRRVLSVQVKNRSRLIEGRMISSSMPVRYLPANSSPQLSRTPLRRLGQLPRQAAAERGTAMKRGYDVWQASDKEQLASGTVQTADGSIACRLFVLAEKNNEE